MKPDHQDHFRTVLTALGTSARSPGGPRRPAEGARRPAPFVTISRQAGSGGRRLAQDLTQALNATSRPDHAWAAWGHELIEKVSAEHHIPATYVEALEDGTHPWFGEFIESLSPSARHEEGLICRRVAVAIRALANDGRAVIVGRGGVFLTAGLEGGVHVRLVAPLEYRVARMAERLHVSTDLAEARVRETDRNRGHFLKRHWPDKPVVPEAFTVTLNTAQLSDRQLVACLVPLLVPGGSGGGVPADDLRQAEWTTPTHLQTGTARAGAT